jgi:hypothetical protein
MAKKPKNEPVDDSAALPAWPQYAQFAPGQRVRDIYGHEHVVDRQNECCVYVQGKSGWYHPSKLHPAD